MGVGFQVTCLSPGEMKAVEVVGIEIPLLSKKATGGGRKLVWNLQVVIEFVKEEDWFLSSLSVSVSLSLCLSVCLSLSLSLSFLSLSVPVCLSMSLSLCLSVCLSVCLSLSLAFSFPV